MACGCRAEWREITTECGTLAQEQHIEFCPLHANAERLRAALRALADLTGPCIEAGTCMHTLCVRIREARVVLREIRPPQGVASP